MASCVADGVDSFSTGHSDLTAYPTEPHRTSPRDRPVTGEDAPSGTTGRVRWLLRQKQENWLWPLRQGRRLSLFWWFTNKNRGAFFVSPLVQTHTKKEKGILCDCRVQDNVIRTGHHRHPFVHKEIVFWKLEREREREDGKIVGLLSARGRFIV